MTKLRFVSTVVSALAVRAPAMCMHSLNRRAEVGITASSFLVEEGDEEERVAAAF